MGNLNNPSINRWGLNLFWYNFSYSDKNNFFLLHLDYLINKLVYLYLNYGLFSKKSIFLNKYWYFSSYYRKKILLFSKNHNLKYFRTCEYKNKLLSENSLIQLRKKQKNIYFSRIWIFQFQKWLVINFFSFKPLKKKKKSIKKRIKDKTFFIDAYKKKSFFFRHYLLINFYLNYFFKINNYYCF